MNLIGTGALQRAGQMSASALTDAPWRAVTALTLHVDAQHAATNVAAGAFCALVLSRRTGLGVSVAVAVAGGALGNVLAATVDGPSWVGASTAVFALLGAMAVAYRSVALCLIAAALGYAAAAPDVSNAAHVGGWLAGLAVGWLVDREDKPAAATQLLCAFGAFGAVALSWAMALGVTL